MKTIHVFTVAAGVEFSKARALLASLRGHHRDWRLHLAVCDAPPSAAAGLGADEIHALDSLAIPNLRRWVFCHTFTELAAALKPFVLRKLLARGDCAAAVYLDSGAAVLSPMTAVADALAESDIVLIPRLTAPERTQEGIAARELPVLQQGTYEPGFIAAASRGEGRDFAAWWSERAYRYCREDVPDGLYTAQRWVDFAPGFFDRVALLRAAHLTAWFGRGSAPSAAGPPDFAYARFADGSPIAPEQRLVYRARPDVQRACPDPFAAGDGGYAAWWKAHARAEYPRLFDPEARAAEVRHLLAFLAYRRDGEDIVGDEAIAPAGGGALSKVAGFIRRIAR